MAELDGISIELKAIAEEYTDDSTDIINQEEGTKNCKENIGGISGNNSVAGVPNKDCDLNICSKTSQHDGNTASKRRKKSRVEFRVRSNLTQDEGSTDLLRKVSNVGHRSSAETRKSFSGMKRRVKIY